MHHRVTNLKAPWPAGTQVGDVLDLPKVPGWAVGKCVPVDDVSVVMGGGGSGPPTLPSAADAQATEAFHALREECVKRIAAAQEVHDADKATMAAQLAAAQEEVAALRAMLAGGGGSGPPTLPSAAPEAPARRRG